MKSRPLCRRYRRAPVTTKSASRAPHFEQTSRAAHSMTVGASPCRSTSSAGSGSIWCEQRLHHTISRTRPAAAMPSVSGAGSSRCRRVAISPICPQSSSRKMSARRWLLRSSATPLPPTVFRCRRVCGRSGAPWRRSTRSQPARRCRRSSRPVSRACICSISAGGGDEGICRRPTSSLCRRQTEASLAGGALFRLGPRVCGALSLPRLSRPSDHRL